MDLHARKLSVIEYLIGVKDEQLFRKIEAAILQFKKETPIEPFTHQQVMDRAEEANRDYLSGRIKDQEQLEKESENW